MDAVLTALAAGRPFVPVTGPTGIGRTTALGEAGEELSRRGARVSAIRFTRDGDAVPVHLPGSEVGFMPLGPVAGAHRSSEIARRAAAAAATVLVRGGGEAALLIDDAQWIDRDSRAVLGALVRRLAGTAVTCVCAIRTPMPDEQRDWLRELRGDALATPVRLRPMTTEEIARKLAVATRAKPDSDLVGRVGELSRGIPAAVRDAIGMLRRGGAVRLIGGTAYLAPMSRPVETPPDNEFLRLLRGLHPKAVAAATAVSVLAPLGEAVPRLVAEVLETGETEVVALLDDLRREGVLHRGRKGRSWRIPVPFLATALSAAMGPFERRRLAAKAVTAVWTGAAECEDPDYLADLVADAGRLIDPGLAFDSLLERSAEAGDRLPLRASRWLGAAIELAENPAQRVTALLAHTELCHARGQHERSLRGAQLLLTSFADQLAPDVAQSVQVMAVRALKSVGDDETLGKIAESWRGWQDDPSQRPVTRALALAMLDRWGEVRDVLADTGERWRAGSATTVLHGSLLEAFAALWTGHSGLFEHLSERDLPAPEGAAARAARSHRTERVTAQASALLVIGDSARAGELLAGADPESLPLGDRAALAAMRGEVEQAVDLARRDRTRSAGRGYHIGYSATQLTIITVLVAQGKLTAAREMLTAAREPGPRLGHLLDIAEARIQWALGESEGAKAKLLACEQAAAERGLAVGLDLCWAELADLALQTGDPDEAKRCLGAIEELAGTMPTSRVLTHAALVRSLVDGDRASAEECLAMVRRRGQPLETATVYEKLVRHGAGDPALLSSAYEIFGGFGALLHRSWSRNLMREHGIVVPGRTRTAAESEHLLAVLVADGLTNKQLSLALRVSEKSVENRLSRLFARTGYRSRIELSAAMRDGGSPLSVRGGAG
ncbi:AAA family ATPase [Amycolatopsis sp. NPDC059021]|uniref:helix-turn-helix transcriptional regulator n=1 Tax=Amycolatopsis sp. NPDC059021 TaxID=3346704 RepID=UPI00366D40F0